MKDGTVASYERHLLRRSFRDGGKVRKETLANLSHLPPEAITAVRAVLAGQTLIDADAAFEVTRSLPHGHAAAVHAMARKLGFPALLGPPGPQRDLAYALVISRVLRPASKLSTAGWWDDVTLGPDLGVAGASTDDIYAAMDWLVSRQDDIEKQLAARHLRRGRHRHVRSVLLLGGGQRIASWPRSGTPGTASAASRRSSTGCSPTTTAGRSRCGCSPAAPPTRRRSPRPLMPSAARSACSKMIMVGDRGMITTARITDLRELDGHGVDHLPAPPRDQEAHGGRRAAAAVAVR